MERYERVEVPTRRCVLIVKRIVQQREIPSYRGAQFDPSSRTFLEKNREPIFPLQNLSFADLTTPEDRVFIDNMQERDQRLLLSQCSLQSEVVIGARVRVRQGEQIDYDKVAKKTNYISDRWKKIYGKISVRMITGAAADYIELSQVMQKAGDGDTFKDITLWTDNPSDQDHPILLKEYKGQWFVGKYERTEKMGNISIMPLIIPVSVVK